MRYARESGRPSTPSADWQAQLESLQRPGLPCLHAPAVPGYVVPWRRWDRDSSSVRVVAAQNPHTVAARPAPERLCGLESVGSRMDELHHVVGVGDHRHVVRRDFDSGCAHSSGELALGVWRDGLIAVGDHEPRRV